MGNFDLRDVLANRAYPTTTVKIWMDEQVFFELAALNRKAAAMKDGDELHAVEAEIAAKEKQRDEQAFTVHLRGTSPRAREDMQSQALSQFPIIRDLYGREDDKRTWERGNLLSELYFAAHITKIVNPAGDVQEVTDDNRRDVARSILGNAPTFSIATVDTAIAALRGDAEMEQYAQQSVDFLSHT